MEGNEKYQELDEKDRARILDIKANFLKSCSCESYHNYECERCKRLAKQGGGDELLGEIVTGRMLFSLGLINDNKYA